MHFSAPCSRSSCEHHGARALCSDCVDALMRDVAVRPPGPGRAAARDDAVRRLLPLARRLARRFRHRGEDLDDLLQVASLGLVKAVDGYDPARGHAFLSYAVPTIVGELKRHLRDRCTDIRLPRPVQEARGPVFQAVEELEQRLCGRTPTSAEIAAHTGLDVSRVESTLRAVRECSTRSLDAEPDDGEGTALLALLGREDAALDRVVDTVTLGSAVRDLPERDRHVLHLRFYREHTQQQIADAIGVSQMQVSRILRNCLARLRQALAGHTGEPAPDRTRPPAAPPEHEVPADHPQTPATPRPADAAATAPQRARPGRRVPRSRPVRAAAHIARVARARHRPAQGRRVPRRGTTAAPPTGHGTRASARPARGGGTCVLPRPPPRGERAGRQRCRPAKLTVSDGRSEPPWTTGGRLRGSRVPGRCAGPGGRTRVA
ncbi:SigB/SigF/SigG family RNA polymerase sigma factor [Streptomyces sediminimaris]|uniref:SigB/SigF/SigG family RNA polymerase sigma factor n=1 Tax=Streptomyces sediminimaris TaxID=3383721 RepID=UPI00399A2CC3